MVIYREGETESNENLSSSSSVNNLFTYFNPKLNGHLLNTK